MNNLCDQCHAKPKHWDGAKLHPFCGKTCAGKATTIGSTVSVPGNSPLCDLCHLRPKYSDGTRTYEYCSKGCASKAGPHGATNALPNPAGISNMCKFCNQRPKYSDGTKTYDYCGKGCAQKAESACLMCLVATKQNHSNFCSQTCTKTAEISAPSVLEVPEGHITFKDVSKQFKESWRHDGSPPPVRHVYKVLATHSALAGYNLYRDRVEARGQFSSRGKGFTAGNERRRWHGTRRTCKLGDKGQIRLCTDSRCSLCSIIRTSFDLSLFASKTSWGRFGKGIYTSSTSSKSNDYSENECVSNLKAVLLNKVVVGKGCKLYIDNTTLTQPPAGFDSVLAETGLILNYDELVVYDNDAIRPSFLVMYEP